MAGAVWTPHRSTMEDLETSSLVNLHDQTLRRLHENGHELTTDAKNKLQAQASTLEQILDQREDATASAEGAGEGPSLDQGRKALGKSCTSPPPTRRRGTSAPEGSRRREDQDERRQAGELGVDWYDGVVVPPCADGEIRNLCCEGCGFVKVLPITCKRRTCATCQHTRYKEMLAKYGEVTKGAQHPKLLTLTLKRGHDPGGMVDRVLAGFKKLRRRDVFDKQTAGAYFLEGKPPDDASGWNVHLHVLVDGPYMPQGRLRRAWTEITHADHAHPIDAELCQDPRLRASGGAPHDLRRSRAWLLEATGASYIVDIRKVSRKGGLGYALGYCMKGSKIKEAWGHEPEDIKEAWESAVKHRNLVQTFGDWHGAGDNDDEGLRCPDCQGTTWYIVEYLGEAAQTVAQANGISLWSMPGTDPPDPQRKLSRYKVTA